MDKVIAQALEKRPAMIKGFLEGAEERWGKAGNSPADAVNYATFGIINPTGAGLEYWSHVADFALTVFTLGMGKGAKTALDSAGLGAVKKYSESEINKILAELKGDGFKNNPMRQAYEKEVADLSKMGDDLLKNGVAEDEVARTLHQARRELGIKYKDATPQPLRDYIYEVNVGRYKDPLGPSYDDMLKNNKTYRQIIESSSRYNPDIDNLLSGFEEWLRRQ